MNRDNHQDHFQARLLIDELEAFLDVRQEELLATLERLNVLRAAVIRRDEAGLANLLEQVSLDAEQRRQMDMTQKQLERRLAEMFDGLDGPVTLSGICACLDGTARLALQQRQRTLQELARRVQNELEATELLLRECARCNRQMLSAILGEKNQTVTYTSQGQTRREIHRGIVSMKF